MLLIRFTARAFRKLLSIYVFSYFPFGFEGRIWDLIVATVSKNFKINLEGQNCVHFYVILSRNVQIFYVMASLQQNGKT